MTVEPCGCITHDGSPVHPCHRAERAEDALAAERQRLAEVHDELCENGHAEHKDCDSRCACVGQGTSRMEMLDQENAALRQRHSEMTQAVGLLTTLAPTMEMDGDHPLAMAQEIVRQVEQRHAETEATAKRWYGVADRAWTALDDSAVAEPDESLADAISALRERHAETVSLVRRGLLLPEPRLPRAATTSKRAWDDDAVAWLASEAKKGLEP